MAAGFSIDLLAPGRLGDVLTANGVRGAARPAAPASTTSRSRNQRGETVALFRGRSHTMQGKPVVAGRADRSAAMPVKTPAPGDLEPIEKASRDEICRRCS